MLRNPKVKRVLGEVPFAAELDWALRGRGLPGGGFKLIELRAALPEWVKEVQASPLRKQEGKKVLLFATLHYWIGHAALSGLALAGLGHELTLATMPYSNWHGPVEKFDLRKREAYIREVFVPARDLLHPATFGGADPAALPDDLAASVDQVSVMDCQYTLQVEEVDRESELYQLRQARNRTAASAALAWIEKEKPDVVILPNGLILEFGAVFQAARYAGLPVVSYEFGEQRDRIWLAQDSPVMLQQTSEMWAARKGQAFSEDQREEVRQLFSPARKLASSTISTAAGRMCPPRALNKSAPSWIWTSAPLCSWPPTSSAIPSPSGEPPSRMI
jgi:hypothetical protein